MGAFIFFIYSHLHFIDLYVHLMPVPQCLDYCNFVVSFETPVFNPSHTILYYQGLLLIHSTLHFLRNFHKKLVNFWKKEKNERNRVEILIDIALNLYITLGRLSIKLRLKSLSVHEHRLSSFI